MEEAIKRLQIALGVLLVALLVIFVAGAAMIISYRPEAPVASSNGSGGADPAPPVAAAAPALDAVAQHGQTLFQNNCAACHAVGDEVLVGPGMKGVTARVPSREWLYKWIRNSSAVIASGDAYGNQIFNKYNKLQMQSFPDLSNEDIDAILKYVEVQGGA